MPGKTNFAIIWNTMDVFGKQAITFSVYIFLARLLQPEDFGLLGMVTVFIMIASLMVDGGFVAALIQKKDVTEKDYSSVFYVNLGVSLIMYLVIYVSSKSIAKFYTQPQLVSILRWLSISLILSSLSIIHYAIYSKKMDFRTIAKIGLASQLISGIAAIIIAKLGGGVWALVWQSIIGNFMNAILFWTVNKWRPQLYFNLKNIIPLFKYGINLMITGIISSTFDNLYYVIIGKFYNPAQLGYYTQANRIQGIPSSKIQQIIQRSTFPEFTRIADNDIKTKTYFINLFRNSLFINFPILISLAALSYDLVLFLLTDKWEAIIPYMQLLCFASLFLPFFSLSSNLILSKGKSFLNLKIELLKKMLIVINILIAFNWGITGLIVGQIINNIIFVFIHLFFVKKFISINTSQLLTVILQYFVIGIIPFFLIRLSLTFFTFGHVLNIFIFGTCYFIIYLSLARIFKLNEQISLSAFLKYISK